MVACQPGVAPLTDEDIAALNAMRTAHVEAVLARDVDAAVDVYAEDALWWGADAPAVEGRAAIQAAIEPQPGMTVQDFDITSIEIDGYGDVAFDRGTFRQTIVIEGAEEPITVVGKYVLIARKQADGTWLWTLDIWNADAPMPQPE